MAGAAIFNLPGNPMQPLAQAILRWRQTKKIFEAALKMTPVLPPNVQDYFINTQPGFFQLLLSLRHPEIVKVLTWRDPHLGNEEMTQSGVRKVYQESGLRKDALPFEIFLHEVDDYLYADIHSDRWVRSRTSNKTYKVEEVLGERFHSQLPQTL